MWLKSGMYKPCIVKPVKSNHKINKSYSQTFCSEHLSNNLIPSSSTTLTNEGSGGVKPLELSLRLLVLCGLGGLIFVLLDSDNGRAYALKTR